MKASELFAGRDGLHTVCNVDKVIEEYRVVRHGDLVGNYGHDDCAPEDHLQYVEIPLSHGRDAMGHDDLVTLANHKVIDENYAAEGCEWADMFLKLAWSNVDVWMVRADVELDEWLADDLGKLDDGCFMPGAEDEYCQMEQDAIDGWWKDGEYRHELAEALLRLDLAPWRVLGDVDILMDRDDLKELVFDAHEATDWVNFHPDYGIEDGWPCYTKVQMDALAKVLSDRFLSAWAAEVNAYEVQGEALIPA